MTDPPVLVQPSDLVMVLLIRDDQRSALLPTVSVSELPNVTARVARCGITAVKLFASGTIRDALGEAGTAPDSLMARAIQEIKATEPALTVMTETCLCSYTPTGDCHLTNVTGEPDVPGTLQALAAQAVAQADAGADTVGPAAMATGSVTAVRDALNEAGHQRVEIMPHVIVQSVLYDAYRATMDAVPASGVRAFQIPPANPDEAVNAGLNYVAEGANQLLLEPALFTADLLTTLTTLTSVPVLPFSVSGEYNALPYTSQIELFGMLKRAGADRIITYAAADLAECLGDSGRPIRIRTALPL